MADAGGRRSRGGDGADDPVMVVRVWWMFTLLLPYS